VTKSLRQTLFAILAIAAVTGMVAVSCSNSDKEETPTDVPATAVALATARPTVTPVPPPTSTPLPTSTPAPTPTATPLPTATPTPPAPDSAVQEMGRLIFEEGVVGEKLFVKSVGAAQWANTSYGCPEPGLFYDTKDAPFNGFVYVLSDGTNSWEFHANEDDTVIIDCSQIAQSTSTTVNITRDEGLRDSTGLTLMRRNFANNQFEEDDPISSADMARVISIFDAETVLPPASTCTTIFRLDFETPSGTKEIEFICEENYKDFSVVWNGMMGSAPIIGNIIGPYLTGDRIPQIPTAAPPPQYVETT